MNRNTDSWASTPKGAGATVPSMVIRATWMVPALFVFGAFELGCGRTGVSSLEPGTHQEVDDDSGTADGEGFEPDATPIDIGPLDAGAPTCLSSSDCATARPALRGCFDVQVESCIDGRCVTECRDTPRTCETVFGGTEDRICLACQGSPMDCVDLCMTANDSVLYEVEASSCERSPWTGEPMVGTLLSSGFCLGCTWCTHALHHVDPPGPIGRYHRLQSFQYLAQIDALGGTCTGTMLPTGLERLYFGCPECSITLVRR